MSDQKKPQENKVWKLSAENLFHLNLDKGVKAIYNNEIGKHFRNEKNRDGPNFIYEYNYGDRNLKIFGKVFNHIDSKSSAGQKGIKQLKDILEERKKAKYETKKIPVIKLNEGLQAFTYEGKQTAKDIFYNNMSY